MATCEYGTLSVYDGERWSTIVEEKAGLGGLMSGLQPDRSGRIWMLSGEVLKVYDGESWENYTVESPGLHYDLIDRIDTFSIDPLWQVWIGTTWRRSRSDWGPAVTVFDGDTWTTFTHENSGLPDHGWVNSIAFDGDGGTWISLFGGLVVKNGDDWIHLTPENSDLVDETVRAVSFDPSGRVWIASEGGLQLIDGEEWQTFDGVDFQCAGLPRAFDENGPLWSGSCTGAVMTFDGMDWEYEIEPSFEYRGHISWSVNDIEMDHRGNIWVGTGDEVCLYDGTKWSRVNSSNSGLMGEGAYSIATDSKGDVWFMNGSGISVLSFSS
ncbi:MAG: two-component regulator propeller domain-containing protein [Anaerolineales bacterium]